MISTGTTSETSSGSLPADENRPIPKKTDDKYEISYIVVMLITFLGVVLTPESYTYGAIKLGIIIQVIMGIVMSFRISFIPRSIILTTLTVGTLALLLVLHG